MFRRTTMSINESTFEARANEAIKYVFPNHIDLQISHQIIFSVKLGHHEERVQPSLKRPRLDILVSYKDTPLAVIELKRPGVSITDTDRDQGLSYARLTKTIAPLVIVTDGEGPTKFYNTYTGQEISPITPDEVAIQKLFSQSFELAASEQEIAIRNLLGKDPDLWEKVISKITTKGLDELKGTPVQQPISDTFQIPREATQRINKMLASKNPVIAVTGAPLIGKTNVLFELCGLYDKQFIPMYINALDCKFGILQYIANHFTRNYFISSTVDDVRHWLIHQVIGKPHPAGKLVLIIDHVTTDQTILNDINELIDIVSDNSDCCSIVFSCSEHDFVQMSRVSGRPSKTLIGRKALSVNISELSDTEFNDVQTILINHYKAVFYQGAEKSMELRLPRVLRLIVSYISNWQPIEGKILKLPTFIQFTLLRVLSKDFQQDHQFTRDMSQLVKGFINIDTTQANVKEFLISYGHGQIEYEHALEFAGEQSIARLFEQGHIDWFQDDDNRKYIYPKVPELFSAIAIDYLILSASKLPVKESIDYILSHSQRFPYGDLVAANIIYKMSQLDTVFLSQSLCKLIEMPPTLKEVSTGYKAITYNKRINFQEFSSEMLAQSGTNIIENHFPWLVLSQLATETIVIYDDSDVINSLSVHSEILKTVGSFPDVLRRYDDFPPIAQGIYTHSIESNGVKGTTICGKEGIIEPITYAIQKGFAKNLDEMIRLSKEAIDEKNVFFAHRLHNAASTLVDIDNVDTARAIRRVIKQLNKLLHPRN